MTLPPVLGVSANSDLYLIISVGIYLKVPIFFVSIVFLSTQSRTDIYNYYNHSVKIINLLRKDSTNTGREKEERIQDEWLNEMQYLEMCAFSLLSFATFL